jgi:ribose-phosphate pyrophosphokinase
LFNNDALTRIQSSGVIEKVVSTNSHPNSVELKSAYLQVESIAPLIVGQLV